MSYCDLHNHLLPGVDDGSESLDETLHFLRRFRAQGVRTLVFTPHLLASELDADGVSDVLDLHRRVFEEVVRAVDGDSAYPELHRGQEILARRPEDLDRVFTHAEVGLAGSDVLLVEFGFSPPFDPEGVIRRVLGEGRRILVAHPERYRLPDEDPVARIAGWREMGALLQVNGGSLLGGYTEQAAETAEALLDEGLVDIVASDHHGHFRTHDPEPTARAISNRAGERARERLLGRAPGELVLAGACKAARA